MKIFTKSSQSDDPTQPFEYNVALRRVIYVSVLGAFVIFLYSSSSPWTGSGNFTSVFSLGLMDAGAAMVSGGLLGFLFGVPHVREEGPPQAKSEGRDNTADQQDDSVASDSSISYRSNTSLEQISDWLTKMLVGVGLVEIKVIPDKLKDIARFVARGLGNKDEAQAFFARFCGLSKDQNYNKDLPSDDHMVKQIRDDLCIASTDTTDDARWASWSSDPDVVKWMRFNKIEV